MPKIKYYKVTCDRLSYPFYYAAYNLKDAKDVFSSDTNSQMIGDFFEITYTDIPATSIIHTAKLEFIDSRAVACRVESLKENKTHD
jgi:hypothetical protein